MAANGRQTHPHAMAARTFLAAVGLAASLTAAAAPTAAQEPASFSAAINPYPLLAGTAAR